MSFLGGEFNKPTQIATQPDQVTFSPSDGRRLVLTGEKAKEAILCDGETGAELERISARGIKEATFSPSGGRLVLTGYNAQEAILCHGETGAELQRIPVRKIDTVTFSPSGGRLVLTGRDAQEAILCHGETGEVLSRLSLSGLSNITFSPDGCFVLLTTEQDSAVFVNCSHLAKESHTSTIKLPETFYGKCSRGFEQNSIYGHYLVICGKTLRIHLFDHDKMFEFAMEGVNDAILMGQPSETNLLEYMVTGSEDSTLRLWDVSDPAHIVLLFSTKGLQMTVEQVRFDQALNVSDTNKQVLSKNDLLLPPVPYEIKCHAAIPSAQRLALTQRAETKEAKVGSVFNQGFFGNASVRV